MKSLLFWNKTYAAILSSLLALSLATACGDDDKEEKDNEEEGVTEEECKKKTDYEWKDNDCVKKEAKADETDAATDGNQAETTTATATTTDKGVTFTLKSDATKGYKAAANAEGVVFKVTGANLNNLKADVFTYTAQAMAAGVEFKLSKGTIAALKTALTLDAALTGAKKASLTFTATTPTTTAKLEGKALYYFASQLGITDTTKLGYLGEKGTAADFVEALKKVIESVKPKTAS